MGLYPGIPGRAELFVTAPLFPRVVVRRASRQTITIVAPGASADAAFVRSLDVDGRRSTRAWLPESFAAKGGELRFELGSAPDPQWASRSIDVPPSFAPRSK